jgi:hypothetical protein
VHHSRLFQIETIEPEFINLGLFWYPENLIWYSNKVMDWLIEESVSIPGKAKRFYHLHSAYLGSEVYLAPYPVSIRVIVAGI